MHNIPIIVAVTLYFLFAHSETKLWDLFQQSKSLIFGFALFNIPIQLKFSSFA